ncbi:hypothetical protein P4H70_32325, partial [Paenibacillus ehimensis]|uniref:hypothetical protein n=1 Tax=Paenibacillus ehimensis TaxID=79264 RepID=UPI002DBF07A2
LVEKVVVYKNRDAYGGGVSTGEAIAAAFVFGKCPLLSGFQSNFPRTRAVGSGYPTHRNLYYLI